eukprot:CAMPEP_0201494208 /NCGR_PEP_ID=MMETSP0151_2-20130828/45941_1 /ASSEMBLY_ACC=CAM_ASM_000257 /TAXON_ID=200890 /ORGANISM="Paramoeba atlantica, Strain 621/1 / CCAP 1560/9" /LENGTH=263 /DNA_ID=CAMNT_0047882293 /DNA_START=171 /DNA_END=962 /DNA_ORIENTATION=-
MPLPSSEEVGMIEVPLNGSYVFCLTFFSALLSGVGILPFAFYGNEIPKQVMGVMNALAAGMMSSASLSLFVESLSANVPYGLLGILIGIISMLISEEILEKKFGGLSIGDLDTSQSRQVILVVGAITSHAFAEGLAMGLSFTGGHVLGVFITIAMALHNIPEGVAIAVVLLSKGVKFMTATFWVSVSHMPQPFFAVLAFSYLGKDLTVTMLPLGLGFAGGAMMFIVITEMIPEACRLTSTLRGLLLTLLAMSAMTTFHIVLSL